MLDSDLLIKASVSYVARDVLSGISIEYLKQVCDRLSINASDETNRDNLLKLIDSKRIKSKETEVWRAINFVFKKESSNIEKLSLEEAEVSKEVLTKRYGLIALGYLLTFDNRSEMKILGSEWYKQGLGFIDKNKKRKSTIKNKIIQKESQLIVDNEDNTVNITDNNTDLQKMGGITVTSDYHINSMQELKDLIEQEKIIILTLTQLNDLVDERNKQQINIIEKDKKKVLEKKEKDKASY